MRLLLDIVVIAVFVVAGRRTHAETNELAQVARTAGPFLIALPAAWLVTSRLPRRRWWSDGPVTALVTTGAGAFLRVAIFDEGVAFPFVFVTLGFMVAGMAAWRFLLERLAVRSTVRATAHTPVS